MSDEIVIDRRVIKALAVPTRLRILEELNVKSRTLSDLSSLLHLSNATIKEHLDALVGAGLISKQNEVHKFKYYSITMKGKRIVNPYETKVRFALFSVMLVMFVVLLIFMKLIFGIYSFGTNSFDLKSVSGANSVNRVNNVNGINNVNNIEISNQTSAKSQEINNNLNPASSSVKRLAKINNGNSSYENKSYNSSESVYNTNGSNESKYGVNNLSNVNNLNELNCMNRVNDSDVNHVGNLSSNKYVINRFKGVEDEGYRTEFIFFVVSVSVLFVLFFIFGFLYDEYRRL
ncbi:MAG: ArsR family transcriptional regulator [Nitrospiraceae bacterium]|nr:ArsR family transcriptional regulator [Nitrospiraceae bacterium]